MPGSFPVRRVRLQLRSGWGPPQSALRRGGPRSPDSTRSSDLEKRGVRNSRMAFIWLFTCRREDWGIEILRGLWCRQRWLISVNLGDPNTLLELTTAATTATVIDTIAVEFASEVVAENVDQSRKWNPVYQIKSPQRSFKRSHPCHGCICASYLGVTVA